VKPARIGPLGVVILFAVIVLACLVAGGCQTTGQGGSAGQPGAGPPFYGEPVTPGAYDGSGAEEPVGAPGY